jgi:predicted enzyme related to lactoylglutathione lyase
MPSSKYLRLPFTGKIECPYTPYLARNLMRIVYETMPSPFTKHLSYSLLVCLFLFNQTISATTIPMEEHKNDSTSTSSNDMLPKVTGVGGIFFFSNNPEKTKNWYRDNLGIDTGPYGASFESKDVNHPSDTNILQWNLFKTGSNYFSPSKKEFMINYTVQHIEALVEKLKKNGVTILDSIESYDYGKFVHIMDEEGNKIELWEPVKDLK